MCLIKCPHIWERPLKKGINNTKECQIEKNSASENSDFIGAERDV
jgi:hypothetical protein